MSRHVDRYALSHVPERHTQLLDAAAASRKSSRIRRNLGQLTACHNDHDRSTAVTDARVHTGGTPQVERFLKICQVHWFEERARSRTMAQVGNDRPLRRGVHAQSSATLPTRKPEHQKGAVPSKVLDIFPQHGSMVRRRPAALRRQSVSRPSPPGRQRKAASQSRVKTVVQAAKDDYLAQLEQVRRTGTPRSPARCAPPAPFTCACRRCRPSTSDPRRRRLLPSPRAASAHPRLPSGGPLAMRPPGSDASPRARTRRAPRTPRTPRPSALCPVHPGRRCHPPPLPPPPLGRDTKPQPRFPHRA